MDTENQQDPKEPVPEPTTQPPRDWRRKMRYPPRRIAINQEYGPWKRLLKLVQEGHASNLFKLKMQQSDQASIFSKGMTFLKGFASMNSNRKITDSALSMLSRKLGIHKKLKSIQLDISCCKEISDVGILDFGNRLLSVTHLRNFELVAKECDGITNSGLKHLASILTKIKLRALHLDFKNCCMLTDDGILVLSQNIYKLTDLTYLDLSFSEYRNSFKVSDNVIKHLAQSITHLKNLTKLQLDFNYQQKVTDQGFIPLSKSFSTCLKLSQLTLEFCNAKISDEGISALTETLANLTTLKRLNFNLSENLKITEIGANAMIENLTKIKTSLRVFNLRLKNCPNIGEKGNTALEEFIKSINSPAEKVQGEKTDVKTE